MLTSAVRRAFTFLVACSVVLQPLFAARAQSTPAPAQTAPSEPQPAVPAPAVPPPAPLTPSQGDPDAGSDAPIADDAGVEELPPSDAAVTELAPEPPAATTGVIEGTVTSLENGAPVAAAKVYVRGEPIEAETSTDGRFTLTVPAGLHRLSIIHGFHETQTADVEALAGQTVTMTMQLTPAQLEYDEFLVTAPRIKGTVAAVLQERRESAQVVDAISVADISRSPDGTASAATRRIVGATIVGGQYLYVRGLGGRYTNVRLNGVPLPSTDPDLPGFQLDLFPASLLSSLNIAKTFTPDIPADFAGGSMNVVTRDFPDDFTLTASIGASTTTETLAHPLRGYDGGDTDFLGFDDGTRDFPSALDDQGLHRERRGEGVPMDEVNAISGQFRSVPELRDRGFVPNINASVSVGDSFKLAGNRLGFLASLGYRYNLQGVQGSFRRVDYNEDTGEIDVIDAFGGEQTTEKALIGALGSASYELAAGHDLTLVSMLTQSSEDRTTLFEIPMLESIGGEPEERSQLRFVQRQLFFNQLLAHHDFEALVLDMQLNAALVQRDQPDTIDLLRRGDPSLFIFEESGERLTSELDQVDLGGGADVTVPIGETKLKGGYMGRFGEREFSARRFKPDDVRRAGMTELPNHEFLDASNAGVLWFYEEVTLEDDAFDADEQLHAGYAMVDTPTLSWLRVTGGARVESSRQAITTGSPFAPNPVFDPEIERTTTDVLPALALTVALRDDMNVRAAYGATVARPVVRELAPVLNRDFVRKRNVIGNPDLLRTYIHNFDLRWELFPTDVEVLAASVFYKDFLHPIESVIEPNLDYTFRNIDGATNYGAELEARIGLDRLWSSLEDLSVGANFAVIHSQIEISEEDLTIATNAKRPMAGQSPYVANLSLGYADDDIGLALNLFYNVFGRRVMDAGLEGLPDTYEEAFHSVDFSGSYKLGEHFTLAASAQNILFYPVRVTQGDVTIARVEEGMQLGVSLGFKN